MAYPKSLTQPFRRNLLWVGAGWRCFFAPYNVAVGSAQGNTANGPTILDLQAIGPFSESSPPTGWTDLGWIMDFKLSPQSKIGQIRSGYRGAVRAQYIGQVGEEFEFKFREIGKMQTQISTGKQTFNLLNNSVASTIGPLNGSGAQAVAMVSYTAANPSITVATGSGSLFQIGQYIAVDQDYTGQYGLVGDNAIPVFQGQVTDIDFIRKTTDYVARITNIVGDVLTLSAQFIGGGSAPTGVPNTGPSAGAKVQRIRGFASREGGTFIMEWSAMFSMTTVDGDQLIIYYPHVSPSQFKDFDGYALENAGSTSLSGYELDAMYSALAFEDPLDGETVVGYKCFFLSASNSAANSGSSRDISY